MKLRSTLAKVLCALLCLAALGCAYRYRFETGLPRSETRISEWRHVGIWGLVPAEPFDLEEACPAGVAEFGSYISAFNWFPALVTLGLYAPRTVYAVCAERVEEVRL